MIKLENFEVTGWEHAIRGMRNPKNSWEKSDSDFCRHADGCSKTSTCDSCPGCFEVGPNDHDLMMKLRNAGTDHRKFMRMITVYVDITAPLYWWKEFDTYKVGTVANSCSTMHKIHAYYFDRADFSCEKLLPPSLKVLDNTITELNFWREKYINGGHVHLGNAQCVLLEPRDKRAWEQMIQLLPSSYNQKRTIMFNYEVLTNMYKSRKNHKLDEWKELCKWIEGLPYSELITGPSIDDIPIANEIMEEAKRRVIEDIRDQLHKCSIHEGVIGVDIVDLIDVDGVLDKIKEAKS